MKLALGLGVAVLALAGEVFAEQPKSEPQPPPANNATDAGGHAQRPVKPRDKRLPSTRTIPRADSRDDAKPVDK